MEKIRLLENTLGFENPKFYFSKKEGRNILRKLSTDAVEALDEKTKKIQSLENEKREQEKQNQIDVENIKELLTEAKSQLDQTKEEHLKLTAAHQEQKATLQEVLEREKTLIAEKTLLKATFTKIQGNFFNLITEYDETKASLEIASNKLKELEQKNSNYEETIRQLANLINPITEHLN